MMKYGMAETSFISCFPRMRGFVPELSGAKFALVLTLVVIVPPRADHNKPKEFN